MINVENNTICSRSFDAAAILFALSFGKYLSLSLSHSKECRVPITDPRSGSKERAVQRNFLYVATGQWSFVLLCCHGNSKSTAASAPLPKSQLSKTMLSESLCITYNSLTQYKICRFCQMVTQFVCTQQERFFFSMNSDRERTKWWMHGRKHTGRHYVLKNAVVYG